MFRVKHDVQKGALAHNEMLYSREFRGPITAIEAMEKCLLVAMGSKLLLHYWDGQRLTEAAFFDAPLLITSVNVIKVLLLPRPQPREPHPPTPSPCRSSNPS